MKIKMLNSAPQSFQLKVTLLLVVSMLCTSATGIFFIHRQASLLQFQELRNKLISIASTSAAVIDTETLLEVPLNKDGVNTSAYKAVAGKLEKIELANPKISDIYILTRTKQKGMWQFMVDPMPSIKVGRRKVITSYPGDRYNAGRFSEMIKSFNGATADKKLEKDEWGITLSGYAPIRDKNGKAVAVLGVDMAADDVYVSEKEMQGKVVAALILAVIVSVVLGMLISAMVTLPISKLSAATGYLARGILSHRVKIRGRDEIGRLGISFNQMAQDLEDSRKRLLDYFYRTVQSLVKILEAKHQYTRGHSERVAEYAQKTALRMGMAKEKAQLLKEIAILHDIGKIGVQESILNKADRLTDEEMAQIRLHPEIGEDILRPVVLDDEMLTIVRGHHERYDSKGYPDKIGRDEINTLAAIVSVADAYDAMTSTRSYRAALTEGQAIVELEKNKGSQFNPEIVERFLEVLRQRE